jgi:orotidine-5'-phosphate decarboxylase
VLLLAGIAKEVGITGLVASPLELAAIRNRFGALFVTVVPGIRPKWSETGDQTRRKNLTHLQPVLLSLPICTELLTVTA